MTEFTTADGETPETAIDRIETARHPRPQDRRCTPAVRCYDARFIPFGQLDALAVAPQLLR